MLRPASRYALLALTCPTDLAGAAWVLLVRLLWGRSLDARDGVLVVVLRAESWPTRTWYRGWGGTTIGHAVMLADDDPHVLAHELVHVAQVEAAAMLGVLLAGVAAAAGASWCVALLVWALTPAASYAGAVLAALLRGRAPYRENVLEAAAYAETR